MLATTERAGENGERLCVQFHVRAAPRAAHQRMEESDGAHVPGENE
jgi:hypothetical protein